MRFEKQGKADKECEDEVCREKKRIGICLPVKGSKMGKLKELHWVRKVAVMGGRERRGRSKVIKV